MIVHAASGVQLRADVLQAAACRRPDRRAIRGRPARTACGALNPVPSATRLSRMRAMTGAISSGSQQWPAAYSAPCAVEIEMEFDRGRTPAMHRAFDHRGPAGVIGPAGGKAGRLADGGDGRKIGFGRRASDRRTRNAAASRRWRRHRAACPPPRTISSIVAMPVESTTGLPVAAQASQKRRDQQFVGGDLVEGDVGRELVHRLADRRACRKIGCRVRRSARRSAPDSPPAIPIPCARGVWRFAPGFPGANMRSIRKSWNFTASQPQSAAASTKASARADRGVIRRGFGNENEALCTGDSDP